MSIEMNAGDVGGKSGEAKSGKAVQTMPSAAPMESNVYIHSYRNIGIPNCGQAAVATLLDHWGYDPFHLPRHAPDPVNKMMYWADTTVIKLICEKYGNDTGLFGATPNRVRSALIAFSDKKISTDIYYSGLNVSWTVLWDNLLALLNKGVIPIVLLECAPLAKALGGWDANPLTGHYVPVWGFRDGFVFIGNSLSPPNKNYPDGNQAIPTGVFQEAWMCKTYPWPLNNVIISYYGTN
jgi:hypothetical protein